jgi:hypothetical protein
VLKYIVFRIFCKLLAKKFSRGLDVKGFEKETIKMKGIRGRVLTSIYFTATCWLKILEIRRFEDRH